jgi:AmmeMemoRadiSam system protein A
MPTLPGAPGAWPAFAREVIERAARGAATEQTPPPPTDSRPHGGVFVTLHKSGRLRGCMGTLDSRAPLAEAIRHAAYCAATQDPRFQPVTPSELSDLKIEVSIMSDPQPMGDIENLQLGQHGILVRRGLQRGLFLPQVAVEHHLDKETFLARCCAEKAGIPAEAWRDPTTEVLLFTTEVQREV